MASVPRVFRVFVSSTFSDLVAERNALQEKVYPRLQEFCRQREARFQAVDLRWGISEEAGRDQQTMNVCLEELRRCQETTDRPNFLVLLGQRYGWRPLPPTISAEEFETILVFLPVEAQQRLQRWYRRDDNAVPAEYCLQARKGEWQQDDVWSSEETLLRAFLLQGMDKVLPDDDPRRVKYEASATHQEILEGAFNATHPEQKVFAYLRTIHGLPRDERSRRYLDLDAQGRQDEDASRRLEQLKEELQRFLPVQHVYEYDAHSAEQGLTNDHLSAFCARVELDLREAIEAELQILEQKSALAQEVDAHAAFGKERGETFLGREDLLQRIATHLDDTTPRPLVLHGLSGSGKTAVVSRAVLERLQRPGMAQVIYRFLGATPASSDLRSLLDGLCRQIAEQTQDDRPIPPELRNLIKELPERLGRATADRPLIVFLDALDQLSLTDGAHSLYWLPRELPAHVRLVVSVLEAEGPAGECSRVARRIFPNECHVTVGVLSVELGASLLDVWLSKAGRTLTAEQRHEVLTRFAGCPRPLYLKLAFEEARRWKSYDGQVQLSSDVPAVLNDLFARLEEPSQHGPLLVRRALGYLVAARNGLTEEELLDVLSADVEFMADFIDRSPTERAKREGGAQVLSRLPIIVWSRLYHDLKAYLTERAADNTRLLSTYHRQVGEVIEQRYLSGDSGLRFHQSLAGYFAGQPNWANEASRRPNRRKGSELPYQQTRGRNWEQLEKTLSGEAALPFLEANAEAGQIFVLAEDFRQAVKALPTERPRRNFLRLLEQAIRNDVQFIARNPTTLFQCLWNSGWWYDCPEKAWHCVPSPEAWHARKPPWAEAGPKLYGLLETWREDKERTTPNFAWFRSLMPPAVEVDLGTYVRLRGHEHRVTGLAFSKDGQRLVSTSLDKTVRVWDVHVGMELQCIQAPGVPQGVAISPDGTLAAVALDDHVVRIWDVWTGEERGLLQGHGGKIDCIQFHGDGRYLITSSSEGSYWQHDDTVRVWDVEAGCERHRLNLPHAPLGPWSFTPDRGQVVLRDQDRSSAITWDVETGAVKLRLGEPGHDLLFAHFSPDGRHVLSGAEDGTVKVHDAATGALVESLTVPATGGYGVLHAQQGLIGVCNERNDHDALELQTGRRWQPLSGLADSPIWEWTTPDGRQAVSATMAGGIWLWETRPGGGNALLCLQMHERYFQGYLPETYVYSPWRVAFSPDGRFLAHPTIEGDIHLVDLTLPVMTLRRHEHRDQIRTADFSPAGDRLVTGSADNTLRTWNAITGRPLLVLTGRQATQHRNKFIESAAFAAGGKVIVSRERYADTVALWDAETGEPLPDPEGLDKVRADDVVISPDGRWLIVPMSSGDVGVWELNSGRARCRLSGHQGAVKAVVVVPPGSELVSSGEDHVLRLWDVESGRQIQASNVASSSLVHLLTGSPDGRLIAGVTEDSCLHVWDARTLVELRNRASGVERVSSICWLANNVLLARSDLALVNVYSSDSLELLGTLEERRPAGLPHSWSPENYRVREEPSETLLLKPRSDDVVARLPVALSGIKMLHNGRTLAGTTYSGGHNFLHRLEGQTPSEPPASAGGERQAPPADAGGSLC